MTTESDFTPWTKLGLLVFVSLLEIGGSLNGLTLKADLHLQLFLFICMQVCTHARTDADTDIHTKMQTHTCTYTHYISIYTYYVAFLATETRQVNSWGLNFPHKSSFSSSEREKQLTNSISSGYYAFCSGCSSWTWKASLTHHCNWLIIFPSLLTHCPHGGTVLEITWHPLTLGYGKLLEYLSTREENASTTHHPQNNVASAHTRLS